MSKKLGFWKGAISGVDNKASMAKCMAWFVLTCIIFSWFAFPGRNTAELIGIFTACLAHAAHGKWSWFRHGKNGGENHGQQD